MYIKIYFNDKPLFLCDRMTDEISVYAHHDDAVLIDEFSPHAVNAMVHEMRLAKIHAGIFVHSDLVALKKAVWKKFIIIQAGGGFVQNGNREILFMYRRSKWDLPKGKRDPGETLEQCAVREVGEETGLHKVQLEAPLLTTYHTYDESGHHILKETYWYRMKATDGQKTVPQQEEQITEIRWVLPEDVGQLQLGKTSYPSIVDVFNAAYPF